MRSRITPVQGVHRPRRPQPGSYRTRSSAVTKQATYSTDYPAICCTNIVRGTGALLLLRRELGVLSLEGVGDVLEEDQPEEHVLVLGRVHVVAQRIGSRPEFCFNAGKIVIRHYNYLPILIEVFGIEYSAGIPAAVPPCG